MSGILAHDLSGIYGGDTYEANTTVTGDPKNEV
jgi:hypothetical protein